MGQKLHLTGTIGLSLWEEKYFTANDVREELEGKSGPLTVHLNSGGGIATEGQEIYNALKNYPDKVTIVIDGIAASAASLVAMAGDEIIMPLGAIMMIHDPATFGVTGRGTEQDHLDTAKNLGIIANAYAAVYAARAGCSVEAARTVMRAETYYDGPSAVAAGFASICDEDSTAQAAAAFDYRLYAKAPAPLHALGAAMAQATPPLSAKGTNMKPKATIPAADPQILATAEEEETRALAASDAGDTPDDPEMQGDDPARPAPEDETQATIAASIIRFSQDRGLPPDLAARYITSGLDLRQVMMLHPKPEIAMTTPRAPLPHARILRDERETRRIGMTDAIVASLSHAREVSGPARDFMGMSLVEMAAATIGYRGRLNNPGQRIEVMMEASTSTSDFPAIFQNAMHKQLLEKYQLADPTYRAISRKRNFRDFRPMPLIRTGDYPMLKPIGEGGEIKWGKFGESSEQALINSYAVGMTINRQSIINDDLGAIDEVLSKYGEMVAMFEEQLFYAFALSAVMSDGKTLFHADHKNLAGSAAAITTTSVSAGRAAMRKQKSIDGNMLNIGPSILLVGPDKETEAEMFVANITATQTSAVNPFSGKLAPVVSAEITGNEWYLLSGNNPCWIYGYLEGAEAPRVRTKEPFGTQGFSMTVEHDFGLGAVDYRGGYKNAGL